MRRILIVGAYLSDRPNGLHAIMSTFECATTCQVHQRWASIGPCIEDPIGRRHTVLDYRVAVPKFTVINSLLAREEWRQYDYIIVCDDDIVLPRRFLDDFIDIQEAVAFRLAQPALTRDSYINHAIIAQATDCVARETLFVECGPLFSIHRSAYRLLLPFETESPMGWGYEYIWSWRLPLHNYLMGIVDAVPVKHDIRESGSYYDRQQALNAQAALLRVHLHRPPADSHKVNRVIQQPLSVSGAAQGYLNRTR